MFIYTLSDDIVSNSEHTGSNVGIVVNSTRKGHGRMRSWSNVIYYTGIFVEDLGKTTLNLDQPSFEPGTSRLQGRSATA
jgi:hypothetical protein